MKTIAKPTQSELKIKKSQFICRLFPSKTKEESKEIISRISEEYSDATHNCSAYITSNGEGFDDNGELIVMNRNYDALIIEVSSERKMVGCFDVDPIVTFKKIEK